MGLDGSWSRSIKHGLRRQDRERFGRSVSKALSRKVVEESNFLIEHAREEMITLHRSLDSSRWLTRFAPIRRASPAERSERVASADAQRAPRP